MLLCRNPHANGTTSAVIDELADEYRRANRQGSAGSQVRVPMGAYDPKQSLVTVRYRVAQLQDPRHEAGDFMSQN